MTLIAAFRCDWISPSVVICADTQETVGGVRVAVNKIIPQACGQYVLAFAGAGNGDLIDSFADSLRLDIARWPSGLDENVMRGNIRNVLLDFYENEVALYPADKAEDKVCHCLVCVKPKDSAEIHLWELRGSSIVAVSDYALLGIDESIYKHELRRLHTKRLSQGQAILLGAHLFSLAKATSNYVGGETQVVVVGEEGFKQLKPERVLDDERRVAEMNKAIAELVLACPDLSIGGNMFNDLLDDFREQVIQLREQSLAVYPDALLIVDLFSMPAAHDPKHRVFIKQETERPAPASKPRRSKGRR